jgi:hypothetical protein
MGFEIFCATMIGLLFGAFVCFAGYRFFLFLLPIWGFFFGFALGVQAVQALIGDAFFATVTSWAVGFVVALTFAVLSYLFYFIAVALIAGSLGYGLVVAIMGAIGIPFGFITWSLGLVVGIALAFVTLRFNLAKYVIIITTALGGAALAVGTLVLGVDGVQLATAATDPIRTMLQGHPFWTIIYLIMAVAGMFIQWRTGRMYTIEAYENRI